MSDSQSPATPEMICDIDTLLLAIGACYYTNSPERTQDYLEEARKAYERINSHLKSVIGSNNFATHLKFRLFPVVNVTYRKGLTSFEITAMNRVDYGIKPVEGDEQVRLEVRDGDITTLEARF